MNLYRQALALLLVATFITAECTYAKMTRVDVPRRQMTISEARKLLVWSLGGLWSRTNLREVKFNRKRVTYKMDRDKTWTDGSVGRTEDLSISFAQYTKLAFEAGRSVSDVTSDGKIVQRFSTGTYASSFIDAVLILKNAALAPDTEEADFAAFSASAKAWLATTPKPEMSDDTRAYKALAEDAFKRKDFPAALDAHGKALDKYPMWPAGQYNTAVLAAETEDYELAALHMRRYLVLAPDAKDAQAAKDKLLLWQLKAKQ